MTGTGVIGFGYRGPNPARNFDSREDCRPIAIRDIDKERLELASRTYPSAKMYSDCNSGRVVVTGGAGFIGSHLVDRLLSADYRVTVIDNFSSGRRENLARHDGNPLLDIQNADILDENRIMELLRGAVYVYHLAGGNLRLSLRLPTAVHDVNATGTFNVLKAAAAAKVKRFMYCSSSEVCGTADIVPVPESYDYRPETIYGASKLAGEYYTRVFQRSGLLNTIIVRPYNNYGPRSHFEGHSGEVIPRFIIAALAGAPLRIFGDGTQSRDFTYVTETADLMVKLMASNASSGETFNICSSMETSINKIAEMILELSGSRSRIEFGNPRPNDVLRLCGDTSKLKNRLGEAPRIFMRDGLSKTFEWFKNNINIDQTLLDTISPENWTDVSAEPWMIREGDENAYGRASTDSLNIKRNIPLTVPALGEEEADSARDAVLSGWVTQGPRVREFEEMFKDYTGTDYACAVSSCTAALHLALKVVGVAPGDVVLTATHSFIATANAIRHCGAEPVFVDIDPDTLNIDAEMIERTIREDFEPSGGALRYRHIKKIAKGESPLCTAAKPEGRLAAILAVHQAGMPADMPQIMNITLRYGIPVIEDAACAIGSEIDMNGAGHWEKIGRPHGALACFSFHPRKVITTGEGGMITTRNPDYDAKLRLLRHHGMSAPDLDRHNSDDFIFEEYLTTGFNYRMSDIQAAVGIVQMKHLPEIVSRRRRLAEIYDSLLVNIPSIKTFAEPRYARTNRQSYVIQLETGSARNKVLEKLLENGIRAGRGIMNAHLEPPYSPAWRKGRLPHSENASGSCIILPLYPGMHDSDIHLIVDVLQSIIVKYRI